MTDAPVTEAPKPDLGFDPATLRARYRAERDKRLRADGNAQYREIKGEFARYLDDPYVEPGFTRAPLTDEVEVVVIGGGFGGLLAGARLREAGVQDIRIIEKGGDFGGTWYWNRYPGAACDIESYIYLPLLEEIGYMPVEKYSRAPEILTALPAPSASTSTSTGTPASRPRSASFAGTRRPSAGSSRPTATTPCAPASWSWPTVRCIGRNCRASPASSAFKTTASTPVAGTMATPAAIRTAA